MPGAHKPDHFIYDTNCDAKQQVMKEPRDPWWDSVGMSVDVWHFLNKHKVSHDFCQKHCNPADFPELLNEDGKSWFFNTSIAEQVNVWLGGDASYRVQFLSRRNDTSPEHCYCGPA